MALKSFALTLSAICASVICLGAEPQIGGERCFLSVLQLGLHEMERCGLDAKDPSVLSLQARLDDAALKLKDCETFPKIQPELEEIEASLIKESEKVYSKPAGSPSVTSNKELRQRFDREFSMLPADWTGNIAALKRFGIEAGPCVEADRVKALCDAGRNWTPAREQALAFYRFTGVEHYRLGADIVASERKFASLLAASSFRAELGAKRLSSDEFRRSFASSIEKWRKAYKLHDYLGAGAAEKESLKIIGDFEKAVYAEDGRTPAARPGASFTSTGTFAFGGSWQTLPCSLARGASFYRNLPSGFPGDFQPYGNNRNEWKVSFGMAGFNIRGYVVEDGSWTYSHRIYDCRKESDGQSSKLECWWSMLSPGALCEAHAPSVAFSCETTGSSKAPDKVALPADGGVRLLKKGESIDPASLDEGWALLIWEDGAPQLPMLVRFERRPSAFEWRNDALVVSRPPEFGRYAAAMLYGASAKPEDWSSSWKGVPDDVARQCRRLAANLTFIPLDIEEFYAIGEKSVKVWDRISKAMELKDDWGAKAAPFIPAPFLYTVADAGVKFDKALPASLVNTKFGFFKAVPGKDLGYELPRVRFWQRNVLKPVQGDDELLADYGKFAIGMGDENKRVYESLEALSGGWCLMDSKTRAWFDFFRKPDELSSLITGRKRAKSGSSMFELNYIIDPVSGIGNYHCGWRGNRHDVSMIGDYTCFNMLYLASAYAQSVYFGRWDLVKGSWPSLLRLYAATSQRQSWFAPGQDCLSVGWIFAGDMLGDGYRANSLMGSLAHAFGDTETELLANYQAARAMASAATLIHPDVVAYNKAVKNLPNVLSKDACVCEIACDEDGILSSAPRPYSMEKSWNAPFQSAGCIIYDYPFFGALLERYPDLMKYWIDTYCRLMPEWHERGGYRKAESHSGTPAERNMNAWQTLKYLAFTTKDRAAVRALYAKDFAPAPEGFSGNWKQFENWKMFLNVLPHLIGQNDPLWIGDWTWATIESGTYDRERREARIVANSLEDGEIDMVSLLEPESVSVNGTLLDSKRYSYSPESHALVLPLSKGSNEIAVVLRGDVAAAAYPAFKGAPVATLNLPPSPPPGLAVEESLCSGDIQVEKTFPIDLRKFCNMGFDDKVANDRQGGTDDNGDSWLFPKGLTAVRGVPFDFIDPDRNDGKSCIVLKGTAKDFLPSEVLKIPVDKSFRRLFFLHGAGYLSGRGAPVVTYVLNFEGGQRRQLVIREGIGIDEWKVKPGGKALPDLKEARAGQPFPPGRKGQWGEGASGYVYEWKNDVGAAGVTNQNNNQQGIAKLESIDIISSNGALPIIFAITGEQ